MDWARPWPDTACWSRTAASRAWPAAEFEGYAGRKVDTAGMTLMPSLADCHVHLVYTGGPDPNAQMNKQARRRSR